MKDQTILIVDDDETTHEVLGVYLERAGYTVEHASDGVSGVEAAQQLLPDLVLLDLEMPRMDGFSVLAAFRKTAALRRMPVLFVTSHDQQHLKVKGLELGAEDYIVKPFAKSEVLARVRGALRRQVYSRPRRGSLEGDLAALGTGELIQTFGLGGRAARIVFPEAGARIELRSGHLLRAEWGAHQGEAALERLLLLSSGTYVVELDPPDLVALSEEETESFPGAQGLLMGLQAGLDEARLSLSRWAPPGTMFGLDGAAAPAALELGSVELVSVEALIGLIPGRLAEAVEVIRQGIEAGWIRIESGLVGSGAFETGASETGASGPMQGSEAPEGAERGDASASSEEDV